MTSPARPDELELELVGDELVGPFSGLELYLLSAYATSSYELRRRPARAPIRRDGPEPGVPSSSWRAILEARDDWLG